MDNSQLADALDEPDIISRFSSQASSIILLYPVEPEILISKVGAARAVLATGTTSDRAQHILTALLTELGTREGGWRLASFIASPGPEKVEQMSDHLWAVLLVPSKWHSHLFHAYLCQFRVMRRKAPAQVDSPSPKPNANHNIISQIKPVPRNDQPKLKAQ